MPNYLRFSLAISWIFCIFAFAKKQMRLWASAQQNSSKLGSAFALHHNCTCKGSLT
jgi:hypothetical protein